MSLRPLNGTIHQRRKIGTPLTLEYPQTFKLPGSSGWGPGLHQELWDTCLQRNAAGGMALHSLLSQHPTPASSAGPRPDLRNVKPHPWQLPLHLQDDASVWKVRGNGPAVVRATQAGPPVPSGALHAGLRNLGAVGRTLSLEAEWSQGGSSSIFP